MARFIALDMSDCNGQNMDMEATALYDDKNRTHYFANEEKARKAISHLAQEYGFNDRQTKKFIKKCKIFMEIV